MENILVAYTAIFMIFAFVFIAFGVFSMGFLIGYKNEENREFRKKHYKSDTITTESDKEKKAKKDWKKFLEYDGSMPYNENKL